MAEKVIDFVTLKDHAPYAQYQIVDVTFSETAYADTEIRHNLKPPTPEHIDYTILRQAQAAVVYHDMTSSRKAWTDGVIRLRCNVASARVTLLLTVSHEKRTLLDTTPSTVVAAAPSHTHSTADITSGTFDASIIGSGTLDAARIPTLDASKIGTGTIADARLPSELAYEDEANTFSQNQLISKTRPVLELLHTGTTKGRLSSHIANALYASHNLSYDGSNWNLDDTGSVGGLVLVDPSNGLELHTATAGANPRTLTKQFRVDRSGNIYERARTTALGDWTSPSFSAGNFTADTGTWTVDSGDVSTYSYAVVGDLMHLVFFLGPTATTGTPGYLKIAIPGGFTASAETRNPIIVSDNGTSKVGQAAVVSGEAFVRIYVDVSGSAWQNGANYVIGQITIPI